MRVTKTDRLPCGLLYSHSAGVFPVGSDSFALAEFFRGRFSRVLDLCCGGGFLALCAVAACPASELYCLDSSPDASELCAHNAAQNGLGGRMHIVTGDLRDAGSLLEPGSFGAVLCNPPYFDPGSGALPADAAAAGARFGCPVDEVCRAASLMLKNGGKLFICYRASRLADLICALRDVSLEPKRLKLEGKAVFIEAVRGAKPGLTFTA